MESNAIPYPLDKETLNKFIVWQSEDGYVRKLDGNSESVGYLPGSTVRFFLNNVETPYDLHWHPAIEMVIPLDGPYIAEVAQQHFELNPGDILVIPSCELHELKAPSVGSRFIFLFDFDVLDRINGFSYLVSFLAQPVLINRTTCLPIFDEEANIVAQLCRDYLQDDGLRELKIYSRLLTFFLNYVKYRMSMEESGTLLQFTEDTRKIYTEKFNAVFTYLDMHFAEDLTLEQVASVVGFSKYHFSRTFKQFSGLNFYDYLSHKRLKFAETLLAKPGLSITEVALQSGFTSVSTFNRTFKKVKGCTPTEYRDLAGTHSD